MVSIDNKVLALLGNFPLFKNIDKMELMDMLNYFSYKKVNKKSYIFKQGDHLISIYFLCTGRVKISRSDNRGREQLVAICNDGEMFPHVGYFFEKVGYPANAFVLVDAHLLYIPNQNIEKLLTNHPKISLILLKVMGEKLTELQCRLEEKILNSTYEQIIKLLLRLAKKHGVKLSNGDFLFLTPFQNKELASIIGSSRETVSRIMNRLESNKMIEMDQKGRLIIKLDLLKNEI